MSINNTDTSDDSKNQSKNKNNTILQTAIVATLVGGAFYMTKTNPVCGSLAKSGVDIGKKYIDGIIQNKTKQTKNHISNGVDELSNGVRGVVADVLDGIKKGFA